MAIPSKNAELYRRFRFYGFGFLLGLLLVSILFKGRSCTMPGSAKLMELEHQTLEISEHDKCMLNCENAGVEDIKQLLQTGKINYDLSDVHKKPYGIYVVEGHDKKGRALTLSIEDSDTTSVFKTITGFADVKDKPCDCK